MPPGANLLSSVELAQHFRRTGAVVVDGELQRRLSGLGAKGRGISAHILAAPPELKWSRGWHKVRQSAPTVWLRRPRDRGPDASDHCRRPARGRGASAHRLAAPGTHTLRAPPRHLAPVP